MKKLSTAMLISLVSCSFCLLSESSVMACAGTSCEGQDPVSAGCDKDAIIVETTLIVDDDRGKVLGEVTLFYSTSCHAKWAQLYHGLDGRVFAQTSIDNILGEHVQSKHVAGYGPRQVHTSMTADGHSIRACGNILQTLPIARFGSDCTSFH